MMQWMKMKKIGKAGGITMDKVQVKVKGKAIFIVDGWGVCKVVESIAEIRVL